MSFILDALKKSQRTRQQQSGPGLIAVETARHAPQPHNWWALVVAIIVINVMVVAAFAYWVARDLPQHEAASAQPAARPAKEPAAPATVSEPAATRMVQPPAVTDPTGTVRDQVRPLSAEVRDSRPASTAAPGATTPAAVTQTRAPAESPVILPSSSEEAGFLPTLSELQLDQRIALSPLHIDVHVFNENPQRRFVLINARKYKEGERLSEGPLLEEIRRDGLVMYYRGQRFLVPRD